MTADLADSGRNNDIKRRFPHQTWRLVRLHIRGNMFVTLLLDHSTPGHFESRDWSNMCHVVK